MNVRSSKVGVGVFSIAVVGVGVAFKQTCFAGLLGKDIGVKREIFTAEDKLVRGGRES